MRSLLLMCVIIIGFFAFLVNGVYKLENRSKKDNTSIKNKDMPKVIVKDKSKAQMENLLNTYEKERSNEMGINDINLSDKFKFLINNTLLLANNEKYDEFMPYINPDFLAFKNINHDIDKLKEYFINRNFKNISCDIVSIEQIDVNTYVANCIYIPSENLNMTPEQYYVFLRERRKSIDERVIIQKINNTYLLAFEGYIKRISVNNPKYDNNVYGITIKNIDVLLKEVVLTVEVHNKLNVSQKFDEMISGIGLMGDEFFTPGILSGNYEMTWVGNEKRLIYINIPYNGAYERSIYVQNPKKEKNIIKF